MTHEELEETVPLYAVGALDRTERQALEAHLLSGCSSCHSALRDYQSLASLLPFGLSPSRPPRVLKARILAARTPLPADGEHGQKEPVKPSLEPGEWLNHLFPPVAPVRSFLFSWVAGIGALIIAAIVGYLGWSYTTRLSEGASKIHQLETVLREQAAALTGLQRELGERTRTMTALQADLERKGNDIAELKEQLLQREAELESVRLELATGKTDGQRDRTPHGEFARLLRHPYVRVVSMSGSEKARAAFAMLLYDANTKKLWLYAANLPECPDGTVYQLWAIDQQPRSVGTFHLEAGETAHLMVSRIPDFERVKRFALSLEPSGGRLQPTGPVYLVGQP